MAFSILTEAEPCLQRPAFALKRGELLPFMSTPTFLSRFISGKYMGVISDVGIE